MNIQSIIDRGRIVDQRNFTFRDQVTFAPDDYPIRCVIVAGELQRVEAGTLDYRNAPYEIRHVIASEVEEVPAPCLLLFCRCEPEANLTRPDPCKLRTCNTCKWWGRITPQYIGSTRMEDTRTRVCEHPRMTGFFIEDGCIHDLLESGPKFGCIHHEPK